MQDTLRTMRDERGRDDRGFTLIELLVVVVIIGVLVAIAVPVYLNYRKGAENKAAQSDVRNAVTMVEQCYTDNGNSYPPSKGPSTAGGQLDFTPPCAADLNVSPGVVLNYILTGTTYQITGKHQGSTTTYTYTSTTGQTTSSG